MNSYFKRAALLTSASALASMSASAQVIVVSDSFEANSSADYTIVNDGVPDGTQTFAFDYVAAGIPLAPRSMAGSRRGLRLTANDTLGQGDAWTLFHNTPVNALQYRLTVDVFMHWDAFGQSTEFAHVGVAGDGSTFNSVFTPISGTGAFFSMTGDGDSASDYRWFRDAANTPPGDMFNTTLPNDHPSYLGNGSNNTGPFFQALYPSPPSTVAGSPANIWTTLEIDVDNVAGVISFYLDGALVFQGDFANSFNGRVSLGLNDVFTSISGAANVFTLYDNLVVEEGSGSLGTIYCSPAIVNSTGGPGEIRATGSIVAAANSLTLRAQGLPNSQFGYFLNSLSQGFVPNPNFSQGNLCLSGAIGRYNALNLIFNTGTSGMGALTLNLASTPTPTGPVAITAGQTWHFQCWYRDLNPMATSNFTDAVTITFQ